MSSDLEQREHKATQPTQATPPAQPAPPIPDKPRSLGTASHMRDVEANDGPGVPHGYIEIFPDAFPTQGLFYPSNTRFFVRAATVEAIRHFSTIDETSPFSVNEGLIDVIKMCLLIKTQGKPLTYKDIKDDDRIHIILAIREVTFVRGENKLAVKVECSCGKENEIEVRNSSFRRADPVDEIMRYYDENGKRFVFKTKSFGDIIITPPSIGIATIVTDYIQKLGAEGKTKAKQMDMSFIKMLPFLVQDYRMTDEKAIKRMHVEFLSWGPEKFQFMNALVEKIRLGVKETLFSSCEQCGEEITTPVTFPGGIRSLFVVSDLSGELI